MKSSLRIIVSGLIAQHPSLAGVAWDYIQYVIGLKQMGHDVYYFEDSGEWPYNLDGGKSGNEWVAASCEKNIRHLQQVFLRYGLQDKWAYFFPYDADWYGMNDHKRNEVLRTADLVINVSGTLEYPGKYRSAKKLVYIDTDPGFTQLKLLNRQEDFTRKVAAHDVHFSFGECLPDYLTNSLPYQWLPTRSPIVLDQWHPRKPAGKAYTTIMNWTSYPPVIYAGRVFGQKDMELARFLNLPARVGNIQLEVAMSRLQHNNWQMNIEKIIAPDLLRPEVLTADGPQALLSRKGWRIADPASVCGAFDTYRSYIENSRGEWSIVKGGYVTAQSGWLGSRSACYLAAGRPVVIEDTGFGKVLPAGRGILSFITIGEAIQCLQSVESDYKFHAEAARSLAETWFDAAKVLGSLIERSFEKPVKKKTLIKK